MLNSHSVDVIKELKLYDVYKICILSAFTGTAGERRSTDTD